jgi:PTH1 family peptidyl-tRNA hydrolase
MHLVVGLGNPGRQYEGHRHNVGFMAAGDLRRAESFPEVREKFSALFTRGEIHGAPVAILMPQTFMNLSGDSVQPAAAFLKVAPANLIVLHDELDIPFGEVRLKQGGGHAGHNGLRSIMQRLGTPDFVRVRVGIGRPPVDFPGDVAAFVLRNFEPNERASLPSVLARALDAVGRVVSDGIGPATKAVNTRL